jgi:hypothetical protein
MKKYHFGVVLALISLALGGCASTGPQYYKAATSQEAFQRDMWECQQIVNQSYGPPPGQSQNSQANAGGAIGYMLARAMSEKGRHRDCMYGRGYQVQQ